MVTDSKDEFAIFDQPLSPEPQVGDSSHPPLVQADNSQEDTSILEEMGIQRKQKSTLQELLESQPERKVAQTKLFTPPPP